MLGSTTDPTWLCQSASERMPHGNPPVVLSDPAPLSSLPASLPPCPPPLHQFLGACTKQKPYIVITELMACSLADAFLKTFYAPTQRRQVEIALDFAKGMAYLHSRRQPIVHRWGRGRVCIQGEFIQLWGFIQLCVRVCGRGGGGRVTGGGGALGRRPWGRPFAIVLVVIRAWETGVLTAAASFSLALSLWLHLSAAGSAGWTWG